MSAVNKLYYGDCLTIMRDKLLLKSVDLIYLDPPFKSEKDYNAIYKDETGKPLPDQVEAFCDTWTLDEATERAIRQMPVLMREAGVDDAVTEFWRLWMNALRNTQPRLLAYLAYMAERLLAMKPLLRPTGSIYLHCDQTANHYIKVLMDAVFGHGNFVNEIVWQRAAGRAKGSQHEARKLGQDVDYILHYSAGKKYYHREITTPLGTLEMQKKFPLIDESGRSYHTEVPIFCSPSMGKRPKLCYTYKGVSNPHPSGWRVSKERLREMDANGEIIWREGKTPLRKSFSENYKGKPVGCLWTDIPNVTSGEEYQGYNTQKPIALLQRIIKSSCPHDGVVLDPFCGCATTIEAAHNLERKWIGIDIAIHAIKRVAAKRLGDRLRLVEESDYQIEGVPQTLEGAQDLWTRDKYHFQKWAVESVDGFVTTRKSGDGGVDGRIYFNLPAKKELQSMAVEVKGGKNVGINVMRELRGVLDDDAAQLAGLIVMEPLGEVKERNFKKFMASAGHLDVSGTLYPRLQMLTVAEILDGRRFQTPGVAARGIGQASLEVSR